MSTRRQKKPQKLGQAIFKRKSANLDDFGRGWWLVGPEGLPGQALSGGGAGRTLQHESLCVCNRILLPGQTMMKAGWQHCSLPNLVLDQKSG